MIFLLLQKILHYIIRDKNNKRQIKETKMEFLTVTEAAAILRINKFTLYKWSKSGKIPSRSFGKNTLRFLASDLEEFTRPDLNGGGDKCKS